MLGERLVSAVRRERMAGIRWLGHRNPPGQLYVKATAFWCWIEMAPLLSEKKTH